MDVKFIGKAKLSKQGQVTVPGEARTDLGISLNSEIYWYEIDDALIVVKELMNPNELKKKILKK